MIRTIKNSIFIIMCILGLASVANAEVRHNMSESNVASASEQTNVSDDLSSQPALTGCGQKMMTPADGGLTDDLVNSAGITVEVHGSTPAQDCSCSYDTCYCCAMGGDSWCCGSVGCCNSQCY